MPDGTLVRMMQPSGKVPLRATFTDAEASGWAGACRQFVGEPGHLIEPVPALSIGTLVGGWSPYTSAWEKALQHLTHRVMSARAGVASPLNVNVIFQVPGNNITPDFEGVRTGHFSKKKMWLIVQAALPEAPPEDVDAHLCDRLLAAIEETEEWARRKGITERLSELRGIVERV